MTRSILPGLIIAAAMAFSPIVGVVCADDSRPPNIVFILADDLGWADLGCYGSTFHKTPNLDALARRGMRFTQAYAAAPLCSPTRASILTGLYPARIGITNPACHLKEEILEEKLVEKAAPNQKVLQAVSITRLKREYFNLAQALKAAGYRTGHFGKWHLGRDPYDPLHQGFDVDFPHYYGPGPAGSYVAPWKFPKEVSLQGKAGEHIEDRVSDEVVKFIHANKDRPFFVNYWCFSVHSPWTAKKDLVEKYRKLADPKSRQCNPVYAAMIESMDDAIGRVVKTIDDLGLAERTIFVFFSDNGGVDWHDEKMTILGMLVPPTSNWPLRAGKASLYEGGTREPCFIVWPGSTKPGSTSDALIQSTDFYPTLLEMIGQRPKAGLKLDGVSFVPALKGGKTARHTLFCHHPHLNMNKADNKSPGAYVRHDDWKLIRRFCGNDDLSDRFELFNLRDDVGESKDLSASNPAKVQELNRLLDGFLQDTRAVIPKANPAYRPGGRWSAGPDAKLEFLDKRAAIESAKGRPSLQLLEAPKTTGPLVLKFRMRATEGKNALVLWGTNKEPGFAAERRAKFEPQRDGQWHDYEVSFTCADTLKSLRIDGSLAPVKLEFEWIRLCQKDGTVIQAWDFMNRPGGR